MLGRELDGLRRACGLRATAHYALGIAAAAPGVLQARSLWPADRRMTNRSWTYSVDDLRITLPGRYFSGAREMYCRRVYFPTPEMQLRPTDVVVDLGANVGLFTLLAALKSRRVLAVEAQSGFAREIESLVREHGVGDKVTIETALVGATTGLLSSPTALQSASHFEGTEPPRIEFAELLAKHGIDRVDFLKMDIEGSEFALFESESWLPRVDRIAMEVHGAFGEVGDLVERLMSAGLEVQQRNNALDPVKVLRGDGYVYASRRP